MLPTDSLERKEAPIYSGVLRYFPLALAAVARLSKIGNDKHNPGEPLHWSREKSNDHGDCIVRHQLEAGTLDVDGELHDVKVAWRALAQLQLAEERRLAEQPLLNDLAPREREPPLCVCVPGHCTREALPEQFGIVSLCRRRVAREVHKLDEPG